MTGRSQEEVEGVSGSWGYTGVGPTVDCSVEMWSSSEAVLVGAHLAGRAVLAGRPEVREGAEVREVEVEARAGAEAEAGGPVWGTAAAAALGTGGGL